MNKKETINFIKNFKENKKILDKKRIEKFEKEIKNKKEEIVQLESNIKSIKE